jgi:CubicO group peptidase (beta-lactamase class C family)
VQRYLPEGVLLPARGQPITLADLATHTSGLPRLPKGLIRQSLRHRDNPYARFTAAHLEHALTEAKLKGEPGDNPELGWAGLPLRGDSRQVLWHNGGTGGFRSFAGFVAEYNTGVVVLSNCSRSVDAIGFQILEAINESQAA